MTKKEYMNPKMNVIQVKQQTNLLASSLQSVTSNGLGTEGELVYDGQGGSQDVAW